MKTLHPFFALLMLLLLMPSGYTTLSAQQTAFQAAPELSGMQVIQFYSKHRCKTCLRIEELSREAVQSFNKLSFTSISVDERQNKELAAQFEASGTALFLFHAETGQRKDLTDFAFMSSGNPEKFKRELQEHIRTFFQL